jgi:hypothetical protein
MPFPKPTLIPTSELIVDDIKDLKEKLFKSGVAVLKLPISQEDRNTALDKTRFYRTANCIFKDEFQIKEPTLEEKLNPKLIVNKAPDSSQGWIHQYATPIHHLVQQNKVFRDAMCLVNDTNDLKFMQNRLRYSRKYALSPKTLHFDGFPFKENNGNIIWDDKPLIAAIIGLAGMRRFCWWDVSGKDLNPLHNYWKKQQKAFTLIDPDFMNKHYPGCRRMVDVDCSQHIHIIVFLENIPHEIASSPCLSLYMSPIKEFDNTKIVKKPTTAQPIEFKNLTIHQTNLLGICYQMGGAEWPSHKKLYQSYHSRAYAHYLPRTNKYFSFNNTNGKLSHQMRLIQNGYINQKSPTYRKELRKKGIILPDIAFHHNTPPFVVDILMFPHIILKDYGFIL